MFISVVCDVCDGKGTNFGLYRKRFIQIFKIV